MDPLTAIIGAVAGAITAILGTKGIEKLITSGADRETSAQAAIIQLATEAISGWREESRNVALLTEAIKDHDKSSGLYYRDMRERQERQEHRLDEIGDRLASLVTILSGREDGRINTPATN